MSAALGPAQHSPADAGMSLVEVLVAIGLFGVLGSLLLGFAISTSRVTDDTRHIAGLSEESRLAMERLTRELRQAGVVTAVHLPSGPTDTTALTFGVDFDGNRFIDPNAADPEVLTYRWSPVTQRLTLTANDPDGTAVTRPVLAGHVTSFTLSLRSSLWQYDADANGTTWQELDTAGLPVGNADGSPDGPELTHIDSVGISLVVADGGHLQSYSTVVDLRNLNLN
jgi:prepilin-type N-terminal cleavage/methylation domain-containing protein